MREINFRAWDYIKKEMVQDWLDLSINKGGDFGDVTLEDTIAFSAAMSTAAQYVMQYTGLTDKNGVAIYEGDICNIKEYDTPTYRLVEVLFSDSRAAFAYRGYYCGKGTGDYFGLRVEDVREVEVIGNIHENPELLTP